MTIRFFLLFLSLSSLSIFGSNAQTDNDNQVNVQSSVSVLKKPLTEFLKEPSPGLYWLPKEITHKDAAYKDFKVLYVNEDMQIFLRLITNGKVQDINDNPMPLYKTELPDPETFKSLVGNNRRLDHIETFLDASGLQSKAFFTLNDNVLCISFIEIISKDNKEGDYISGYPIKHNGLNGGWWLNLKNGKSTFFPCYVPGSPMDVLQNEKFQIGRVKFFFSDIKKIHPSLEEFLKSSPAPGLYKIPENISMPAYAPYQGIYVQQNGRILLCPATEPWSDDKYFYEDQCFSYVSQIPDISAMEKLATPNGISLQDFLNKLNLTGCGKIIDKERNSCEINLFTCADRKIICKRITIMLQDANVAISTIAIDDCSSESDNPETIDMFSCPKTDTMIPESSILVLPKKLSEFLKAPLSGLYWLPPEIKHSDSRSVSGYKVLYVTDDKQILLVPYYNGQVNTSRRNSALYIEQSIFKPETLRSVIGKNTNIPELNKILGINDLRPSHMLFTIDGNLIKLHGLRLLSIGKDFVDFAVFSSDEKRAELTGSSWFDIHSGKTVFHPENVYGNPYELIINADIPREAIAYTPAKQIQIPFDKFLKSSPEHGLYKLPENVKKPDNLPYQGIYVTQDKQILLCPAIFPWDESDHFYKDQCYIYSPEIPSTENVKKLAAREGININLLLEKLNLKSCVIRRNEKYNNLIINIFTYCDNQIICAKITVPYNSANKTAYCVLIESVSGNSSYINMRTGAIE